MCSSACKEKKEPRAWTLAFFSKKQREHHF
jgi:hypothetical protein